MYRIFQAVRYIYVNYYTELSMKKLFGTLENNIIYTGNNIIKVT
jgi:hypothetical protein